MPCASSAVVILPVWAGSSPVESSWYEGALIALRPSSAMTRIAAADTARMAFDRVGRCIRLETNDGMSDHSDLGAEDLLRGLDGLRAQGGRELHGQLGSLDRHDHRGGVVGLARGQLAGGLAGLVLRVLQRLQGAGQRAAEAAAGRRCGR